MASFCCLRLLLVVSLLCPSFVFVVAVGLLCLFVVALVVLVVLVGVAVVRVVVVVPVVVAVVCVLFPSPGQLSPIHRHN